MSPRESPTPAGGAFPVKPVRPSENQLTRERHFASEAYKRLHREANWFLRGRHCLIVLGLLLSFASAAASLVADKDVYRVLGGLLSLGSGVMTALGTLITPRKTAAKYALCNAWRRLRDDYNDLLACIDDELRLSTPTAAAKYEQLRETSKALEDAETEELGEGSSAIPMVKSDAS